MDIGLLLYFFWKHIFSYLEKRMKNYSLKSSSKYSKQFPDFFADTGDV